MMLEFKDVSVNYDKVKALKDVSLEVAEGEMVSIVGANGAGKTTTLKTIMGLLHPAAGEVWFEGERIDGKRTEDIVRRGVAFCMEGRRLFPFMSVLENLQMGAFSRRGGGGREQLEKVYELFPDLRDRLKQKAGTLSGGQQQMVTIGRSLMSGPKLLMLDRAVAGSGADGGERGGQDRQGAQPAGPHRAARRAERAHGAPDLRPCLRPRGRRGRRVWGFGVTRPERLRQTRVFGGIGVTVLSWPSRVDDTSP